MFTGRIDRLGYFLGYLFTTVPLFVICVLLLVLLGVEKGNPNALLAPINIILGILALVWVFGGIPVSIGLSVRRWHDMNQPGLWAIVSILPFLSGICFLVQLFFRGTNGPNTYGEPQRPRDFDRVLFGPRPADKAPVAPVPAPAAEQPANGTDENGQQ